MEIIFLRNVQAYYKPMLKALFNFSYIDGDEVANFKNFLSYFLLIIKSVIRNRRNNGFLDAKMHYMWHNSWKYEKLSWCQQVQLKLDNEKPFSFE